MVLMESFFCYASVRLGVFIISFLAMTKSIFVICVVSTNALGVMSRLLVMFQNDPHYVNTEVIKNTLDWVQKYPREALLYVNIYNGSHIITCFQSAYAAYKLKAWHVLPLAIYELIFLVELTSALFIFLNVVKHLVSLGVLVLLAVIAMAYILLVGYDFLALIAFIQIVRLVQSERYQLFYGTDPLNPKRQAQVKIVSKYPHTKHLSKH